MEFDEYFEKSYADDTLIDGFYKENNQAITEYASVTGKDEDDPDTLVDYVEANWEEYKSYALKEFLKLK